jgi:hypothetical protein
MMDVADFVMKYIVSDVSPHIQNVEVYYIDFNLTKVLGLVATNWLIIADQKGNITNPECLKLAKLHSDAVDYQKTGRKVELDAIPKVKLPKPDWSRPETMDSMVDQDGRYYQSNTALGKLTRKINLSAHEPATPPRVKPRHGGRAAMDNVDDVSNGLSTLSLGDNVTHAILDIVKPLVIKFINPYAQVRPDISEHISSQFKWFSDELKGIASRYSLSHRHFKPLSEDEVIVGTITQKTSQPALRKDKIAKLKEATDHAFRKVKEALEGSDERPPKEYLGHAWRAWQFSLDEMRRGSFGAKAFWWISIGAVFDAMKLVEESGTTDTRSARGRRV